MEVDTLKTEISSKDKTINNLKQYKKEYDTAIKKQERAEQSEQHTLSLNSDLQKKVINNTGTIMSKLNFKLFFKSITM